MATIAQDQPVNTMTPITDLAPRLRRDLAFSKAAQLLADAVHGAQGKPMDRLASLSVVDREFYKTTSRALIEVFEQLTAGKESDAVLAARQAAITEGTAKLQAAIESRLLQERSRARFLATERGHDLLPFRSLPLVVDGNEGSMCQRCGRIVNITLGDEPVLSGSALTEGCLSVATEGDPRR